MRESDIAQAAAQVMGCSSVRYFTDQLLVKEPGTPAETPWHQDYPYFPCEGEQVCSVWLGLDTVTRDSGAMSFVPGSHLWNKLYTPRSFGTQAAYGQDPLDGPVPDINADPIAYPTICHEMEPGDVTIHHARTLHGARGNASATRRRRGWTVRLVTDGVA